MSEVKRYFVHWAELAEAINCHDAPPPDDGTSDHRVVLASDYDDLAAREARLREALRLVVETGGNGGSDGPRHNAAMDIAVEALSEQP